MRQPRSIPTAAVVTALLFQGSLEGLAANDPLTCRDNVVQLTVQVQTNPVQITLSWPYPAAISAAPANAIYRVYKRLYGATSWAQVAAVTGQTSYVDASVSVGTAYEFRTDVYNQSVAYSGYVCTGVELPTPEDRGKLVLVVERSLEAPLTHELARFERDLTGDGWTVIRKVTDACRIGQAGWINAVVSTRTLIQSEYQADSDHVKAAILFGAVPIALSGWTSPDGHEPRAYPTDLYYADMDGTWTDTRSWVGMTPGSGQNYPGDGRFDQEAIILNGTYDMFPSKPELMVGRVDLSQFSTIGDPTALLRQYLNKDHNFRNGILCIPRRALIKDGFIVNDGSDLMMFSTAAWRDFPAMIGASNIVENYWLGSSTNQAFLLGYGCGPGNYFGCDRMEANGQMLLGVDLAKRDSKVVFSRFFGSYFGEFNTYFLAAPLLTKTCGLATLWSTANWTGVDSLWGTMAMGEPIGAVSKRLQTRATDMSPYNAFANLTVDALPSTVVSLMGDPTLRLHPIAAPQDMTATVNGGVVLSWRSAGSGVGLFHVYRANSLSGPFTRLNNAPVAGTNYTDSTARSADAVYMVRPLKLELTPSGSYWNLGQGAFLKVGLSGAINHPPRATNQACTAIADVAQSIPLAATDSDGDALVISILTHPQHGILTGTGTNLFYTATAMFSGSDSFTYTVNDGQADSPTATVNLMVEIPTPRPLQALEVINVDFNGNENGGGTMGPTYSGQGALSDPDRNHWNGVNCSTLNDFAVANLKTSAGSIISSVGFTFDLVSGGGGVYHAITDRTPNNATALMEDWLFFGGSSHVNLTITGLTPGGSHDLVFYGSSDGNWASAFTVSGVTKITGPSSTSTAALTAGEDYVVFSSITADAGGQIAVSWSNAPGYANYPAFNGFQLRANGGTPAANHAPTAQSQSVTATQGVARLVTLKATDPDGDALSYTVITPPAHGTLAGTPPTVTYTPAANYTGTDGFTFRANDGSLDSNVGTVSIDVSAAVTATAPVSGYIQLINVDVRVGTVYGGSAAGPTGLGTAWNSFTGGNLDALVNGLGVATTAKFRNTSDGPQGGPYNNGSGNVGIVVTGDSGLNLDFFYIATPGSQFGSDPSMTYQFSNLTTSVNGNGKWDVYLYLNTDTTSPFSATITGNSTSTQTGTILGGTGAQATRWIQGTSYWRFRDITPTGGTITLNVQVPGGIANRYIWFNGVQVAEQSRQSPTSVLIIR